jgi:hypothetical protein
MQGILKRFYDLICEYNSLLTSFQSSYLATLAKSCMFFLGLKKRDKFPHSGSTVQGEIIISSYIKDSWNVVKENLQLKQNMQLQSCFLVKNNKHAVQYAFKKAE